MSKPKLTPPNIPGPVHFAQGGSKKPVSARALQQMNSAQLFRLASEIQLPQGKVNVKDLSEDDDQILQALAVSVGGKNAVAHPRPPTRRWQ